MPVLIRLCFLAYFRDDLSAHRGDFTVKIYVKHTKHCCAFMLNEFLVNLQIQKCKKYAKRLHKLIILLPCFCSNEDNGLPAKSHQYLFLNYSIICNQLHVDKNNSLKK